MQDKKGTQFISEFFKRVIKNSRLTYDDVAERLGLEARQNVSYVLNHMYDGFWTYENLALWCEAFDTTIEKAVSDYDANKKSVAVSADKKHE